MGCIAGDRVAELRVTRVAQIPVLARHSGLRAGLCAVVRGGVAVAEPLCGVPQASRMRRAGNRCVQTHSLGRRGPQARG